MKTLILAGGKGTRLGSLTRAVNKQLLPLGDSPVISHVFTTTCLISNHVLLITNADDLSSFAKLISNNESFDGFMTYYAVQEKPDGIADAIRYGEYFCRRDAAFVILGDNLFDIPNIEVIKGVCDEVKKEAAGKPNHKFGAHIWVKKVKNPQDYGVLTVDDDGKPVSVVEKPDQPSSDLAIVGAYLFDCRVWDIIPHLTKSGRGEYEITGILNAYLDFDQLYYHELPGEWFDIGGSIEGYWKVVSHMRDAQCTFWSQERGDSSAVPSSEP